tara:strand:- start:1930 stop:2439 length:510 start_codon:yes stop_codon:yes gene_type:complete
MVKYIRLAVYRKAEDGLYPNGRNRCCRILSMESGGDRRSDTHAQEIVMTDSMVRRPPPSATGSLPAMPYAVASDEDRCALRHQLLIPAKMRFSCSSSFPVAVVDMSIAGFACDALVQAHPGTLCWLTLPGLGALEAEVVRHDHQGMGCAFKNMLNLAVLNHYVAKYPAK